MNDLQNEPSLSTLPKVVSFDSLMGSYPQQPQAIIEGVIGAGDKLIVSAPSKAGKTWLLLQLAYSVQNGENWLGHSCKKSDVLYVNLELSENWLAVRGRTILRGRPDDIEHPCTLTLRGFNVNWMTLTEHIKRHISTSSKWYGMIILDPIYKMLGESEENSNGDIAQLLNELERMGRETGTAVVFSHHHSKGNKSNVDAIERMAGAGTWGRDPDAIIDLAPHNDDDCYTVESVTRNYPKPEKVVVRCDFPNFVEVDLDPYDLKKPGGSKKKVTVENVVEMCNTVPLGIPVPELLKKLSKAYTVNIETARPRVKEAIKDGPCYMEGKLVRVMANNQNPK